MNGSEKSVLRKMMSSKVVFFGAGSSGKKTFLLLKSYNLNTDNVMAFVDNNPESHGTFIEGVRVLSTAELLALGKETPIIITSCFFDEIYKQLIELGFENIHYFPIQFIENHLNGKLQQAIERNKDQIANLYEILSDEKSRVTMNAALRYRETLDMGDIVPHISTNEYLEDILCFNYNECIIDAGAYNGDTVALFSRSLKGKFEKIYAFEPSLHNFKELERLAMQSPYRDKIVVENKGLFNTSGIIKFNDSGDLGARIDTENDYTFSTFDITLSRDNQEIIKVSDPGSDQVEVETIDNYFRNKKVTYIKMDIEGAERFALEGATEIIKQQKPKLAICLYHKIDDFWHIPLLIRKLNPDYKIYIRHYSNTIYDSVCYAV